MKAGTYPFHQRQWRKWGKRIAQERMARGVCLSCDERPEMNPRTGKPFLRCKTHRAVALGHQTKTLKEQQAVWRAHGNCIICGTPCGKNLSTGRTFARCLTHRIQNNRSAAKIRKNNLVLLSIFVAIRFG